MSVELAFNDDFRDALDCLTAAGARFLVVGAHALAAHGVPRATGDVDIWIELSTANADRVWSALQRFGAPLEGLGVSRADLELPDLVIQLGLPPRRIDILTGISGVEFAEAWSERLELEIGTLRVPFLGLRALSKNKLATGRTKDLADLEALGEAKPRL